MRKRHLLPLAILLLPACADPPVVVGTVHGVRSAPTATGSQHVVLAWHYAEDLSTDWTIVESTGLRGTVPATFELPVLAPPDAAYWPVDATVDGVIVESNRFTFAQIAAVADLDQPFEYPNLSGVASGHVVACADADVVAGGEFATVMGGPLAAGCRLMAIDHHEVENAECLARCLDAGGGQGCYEMTPIGPTFSPAPDGFDTAVTIEPLEPGDRLPFWSWIGPDVFECGTFE